MDKLPLKYRLLQIIADNYVLILFLVYILGVATGTLLELDMLLSSNG